MSLQTLILDNIEVLGYSHKNNFFGENSINYSATKTLSIRGFVLDLQNTMGVKNIFNNTSIIKSIVGNLQNITINGQNLGIGKFTSLSFDEGNWVKTTRFNANIEIYVEIPLLSLTSQEFKTAEDSYIANGGTSPVLNNLIFYRTGNKTNGRFIYYDTTNTYALSSIANFWRITLISQLGGSIVGVPRFQIASSAQTPPLGNYLGVPGFNGTVILSLNTITYLNLQDDRLSLIKSFSESFNIDTDLNTQNVNGTHTIEIEYNTDNVNLDVIKLAQKLAVDLLNATIPLNLSNFNYASRLINSYYVLNNESYDVINGKCGFTRTFSYNQNYGSRPYSVKRNITIDIKEDGMGSITENTTIEAENSIPNLYANALIGLNEQITGTFNRCSGIFNVYKNKFNVSGNLNSLPLQRNLNINKYNGTINYEINFSTDKKFSAQNYTFEYASTLDRSENFIWTSSEQGTINGIGSQLLRYNGAEVGWGVVKNNIVSRATNFWNANADDRASNNLNLITKQVSRSPYQGQITYNYSFSDDPTIRTDLGNIKKLDIEYQDDGAAGNNLKPIYREYIIPNNTYALVQNRNLKEQGTFSISAKADIALPNQTDIFNGRTYFDTLKTQVRNMLTNAGTSDRYLESANYSSDEIEQTVTYEEVYKYS